MNSFLTNKEGHMEASRTHLFVKILPAAIILLSLLFPWLFLALH